jgi:hypothetical protein
LVPSLVVIVSLVIIVFISVFGCRFFVGRDASSIANAQGRSWDLGTRLPGVSEIRDIHRPFVIERPIPVIGSPCLRHFRVNSIALELARSIRPWSYFQRETKEPQRIGSAFVHGPARRIG